MTKHMTRKGLKFGVAAKDSLNAAHHNANSAFTREPTKKPPAEKPTGKAAQRRLRQALRRKKSETLEEWQNRIDALQAAPGEAFVL